MVFITSADLDAFNEVSEICTKGGTAQFLVGARLMPAFWLRHYPLEQKDKLAAKVLIADC